MSTTHILASLIGLYFLAAGIGLLRERDDVETYVKDLMDKPLLGFLAGLLAFCIGGAIVAVHNDWNSLLSGFVTFVGWASLVEGVLMLSVRRWFIGLFSKLMLSTKVLSAFGAITTVLGALLLITVLFGF